MELDRVNIPPMPGLRERKKHATRTAIHDGAMRLFEARGFAGTTIDQIAEAANVSRATVFSYYRTKEDIVFGEAPQAIEALAAALAGTPAGSIVPAVREWLRQLTGWLEPDLLLQRRLAREVPVVGARRLQIFRDVEAVVAEALERERGPDEHLATRLAAASLMAALGVAEDAAAARMEQDKRALTDTEIDAVLDDAVAFAEAGMAGLRARGG
jgi:AcrR family transcriptional regulator